MSVTVYVPRDAARAVAGRGRRRDADRRRSRPRATIDMRIVRNGSRGLFWLEPLVEVERSPVGASAYGPVRPS